LYYRLPANWRFIVRRIVYFPADAWAKLTIKQNDLLPPKGKIFTGGGDFKAIGLQSLELFKRFGKLKPHHRVLDIGSGIGRMAIPLTSFINSSGAYYGFDIVEEGVNWCTTEISSRFSNFNFQKVDLINDLYNPYGTIEPVNFVFPYQDASFDFVLLTSVFTHMLDTEISHYLYEIRRVLDVDAHCYATFFILTDNSKSNLELGKSTMNFAYDYGHYRLCDNKVVTANIALEQSYLFEIYEKAGLEITHIEHGWWSHGNKTEEYQDIVIARIKR
jgi:SAM-dependent methyltransferase